MPDKKHIPPEAGPTLGDRESTMAVRESDMRDRESGMTDREHGMNDREEHGVVNRADAAVLGHRWAVIVNRLYWVAALFIVVQCLFLASLIYLRSTQAALATQVETVRTDQLSSREIAYKNRAAICINLVKLGGALATVCDEPEVRAYYDPATISLLASTEDSYKNRAVICLAVKSRGEVLPDLCLEPTVTKYYPTASR